MYIFLSLSLSLYIYINICVCIYIYRYRYRYRYMAKCTVMGGQQMCNQAYRPCNDGGVRKKENAFLLRP